MELLGNLLNAEADRNHEKWKMEQQLEAQKQQLDFDKERHKAEMEMAKEQMKMQSEMQKVSLEYQDQWNDKQNELTKQQMEFDHEIAERKEDREDEKLKSQQSQQEFEQQLTVEDKAREQEQQDYAIQRQREEDRRADKIVEEGEANDVTVAYMFLQNCGNAIKKATFGSYNILIIHDDAADEFEDEFQDAVFPLDPVKVMMPSGRTLYYTVHIFKEGTYIRNGSQAKHKLFFWPPQAKQLGMVEEDEDEDEYEELDGEEDLDGEEYDGEEDELDGEDFEEDDFEGDEEDAEGEEADVETEEIEGEDDDAEHADGEEVDGEEVDGEEDDGADDAEAEDDEEDPEAEGDEVQAAVMPQGAAGQIAARRDQLAKQREKGLEDEDDEEPSEPMRLVFSRMDDVAAEVIETMTRAMIDDAQIDTRLFQSAMQNPGNVSAMIGASGADLDEEQQTQYARQGQAASRAEQADGYYQEDQMDPNRGQGPPMQGTDTARDSMSQGAAGFQNGSGGALPLDPIGTPQDPPPPPPPGGQLPQLGQAKQVAGMDRALDPTAGGPVQPPGQFKSAADMQIDPTSNPTGPMMNMGSQNGGGGGSGTGQMLMDAGASYLGSRAGARAGGGQQGGGYGGQQGY
jgi:hypothetical protein